MRRHAPPVLAALAVMLVGMLCSVHGTAKGGAESSDTSVRDRLAARPGAAAAGGAAAARRLNAAGGGRQLRALPDGCTQLQAPGMTPPFGREPYQSYRMYQYICEYKRPTPEGPPLTLGVWLPPGFDPADAPTRARPVVLFVHGGAWRAGSVNSIYAYRFLNGGPNGAIELIQNTTDPEDAPVIVGVTYRLTSAGGIYGDENVTWPAQLEDVFDAMRWLWGHADRLGIDPSRMACFGESSGAHICTHAAIRGVDERETQLVGAMLHMPPLSFYQPVIVRTEGSGSPVVLEPVCCCPPENATDTCGSCEHVSGTPYEGLAHCGYGGAYDSRHWTQPGEEYQDLVSSLPVQGLLGDSPLAVVAHQADPDPEWRAKFARFLDLDPLAAHFSGERPVPSFFTIHGTEDVTAAYEYGGPRLHAALEELPDADRRVDKLVSIKGMSHSPTNEQLPLLADKFRTGFEWLRERLAPSAPSENTETGKKKKAKKKKEKKAKKAKKKKKAKKDKMKCEAAKTRTKCQKVKASCIFKKKRCRLE